MRIVIHRGIDQIGGCITEISTTHTKIVIDLGSNLPGCNGREFTKQEIEDITKDADGIYYNEADKTAANVFKFSAEERGRADQPRSI